MHKLRVAAIIAALSGSLAAQTVNLQQSPLSKLSTVLADLVAAQSVRTARLTTEQMPASVRDAVRGGLLRISESNEVQVYILVPAVTDAVVAQLESAGATIEIADAAARR